MRLPVNRHSDQRERLGEATFHVNGLATPLGEGRMPFRLLKWCAANTTFSEAVILQFGAELTIGVPLEPKRPEGARRRRQSSMLSNSPRHRVQAESPQRYRCETTSVTGFVQQIACCYLRHGYWWYVTGVIPDNKDPRSVDRKLIERYDIDCTEWRRAANRKSGRANVQYIRHEHFFVLLATKGDHRFYQDEASQIRDIRRVPLRYKGYSISYRPGGRTRQGEKDPRWHAHVQIDKQKYRELKAWFESIATRRNQQFLTEAMSNIPWQSYAPVRRQKLNVLRAVNTRRREKGLSTVPPSSLNLRRRIVRPFFSSPE